MEEEESTNENLSEQATVTISCPVRCSVCLGDIEENDRYELDCGHAFHTRCIVQWFRSCSGGPCPNCRANEPVELEFGEAMTRARYLRRYSTRRDAPKELKKMATRVRSREKKQRNAFRELKEYRKKHKKTLDKLNRLRTVYYRKQNSVDDLIYQMGSRHFQGVTTPLVYQSR